MTLAKIMTPNPITLTLDGTLADAKAIFDQNQFHHILIVDEHNELMGVITDRDLYKNLSPTIGTIKETHQDAAFLKKKVNLIMSRTLVTAPKTASLKTIITLLHDNHVSCLPIVDEQLKIEGIVTWRDILKLLVVHFRNE